MMMPDFHFNDFQLGRLLGSIDAIDTEHSMIAEDLKVLREARALIVNAYVDDAEKVLEQRIVELEYALNESDQEPPDQTRLDLGGKVG